LVNYRCNYCAGLGSPLKLVIAENSNNIFDDVFAFGFFGLAIVFRRHQIEAELIINFIQLIHGFGEVTRRYVISFAFIVIDFNVIAGGGGFGLLEREGRRFGLVGRGVKTPILLEPIKSSTSLSISRV